MNFDIKSITWDDEKRKDRAKLIAEEISKSIKIKKQYTALLSFRKIIHNE